MKPEERSFVNAELVVPVNRAFSMLEPNKSEGRSLELIRCLVKSSDGASLGALIRRRTC